MRRLFVDKIESESIVLTSENHFHLSRVLRAKIGDEVTLCPQDGYDYNCKITGFSKDSTSLTVLSKILNDTEPKINVTLFVAMLKGDKLDLVVQKAVELGVHEIKIFDSQNVQVKSESINITRLNKIALEAAKQCGRGIIPNVGGVLNFNKAAEEFEKYDLKVFPYENEKELSLKQGLEDGCKKSINSAAIIIGSEGGFTEAEAQALSKCAKSVSLGKRILRAETACIAVVSAVMFFLNEWQY